MFAISTDDGEGEVYLGSATATSGNFTLEVAALPYAYLTTTATDPTDSTSEFSAVFTAPMVYPIYLPIVLR